MMKRKKNSNKNDDRNKNMKNKKYEKYKKKKKPLVGYRLHCVAKNHPMHFIIGSNFIIPAIG